MKMKPAHFLMSLGLVVALALGVSTKVSAKKAKGVELTDAVVVTATVVGLDKTERIVSLQGPEGNVVDVQVGKAARNFDQIKVGDHVKITYYESVAVYLGKPGTHPAAQAGMMVVRAPKGQMPGGVAVATVDVAATVQAIDRANRTLTLKLPEGNEVTSKVSKSVKAFDTLKVGDSVNARLTKAIAISVKRT